VTEEIPVGTVVRITWGEPVEEITAIVQRWTDDGVVYSDVHDHTQRNGYAFLAAAAVHSVEALPDDHATVRHLRAVGTRRHAEQVEHGSLTEVLAWAKEQGLLVFVQDAEDGSDAGSVGRVLRIEGETVVFDDVDLEGRTTGDELVRHLDDIDHLSWDDDYLRALTVLDGLAD
jgi:hypothetical protein